MLCSVQFYSEEIPEVQPDGREHSTMLISSKVFSLFKNDPIKTHPHGVPSLPETTFGQQCQTGRDGDEGKEPTKPPRGPESEQKPPFC